MHADRQPQPVKEVSQWIVNLQFPHGQERSRAENHTEKGVDHERSHADKEHSPETVGFFMDHVSRWIAYAKEAHVIDRQPEELAEKKVGGLVDDDARERCQRDYKTGNKKHRSPISFPCRCGSGGRIPAY